MCNIFVQIHNKGIAKVVQKVSVKLFYANMPPDGTVSRITERFLDILYLYRRF